MEKGWKDHLKDKIGGKGGQFVGYVQLERFKYRQFEKSERENELNRKEDRGVKELDSIYEKGG